MPASVEKLLNSQYVQLALAALAFLIALWFVVVIARMLMGGRLRLPGGRTRQARLGIVDAFDLDRQRQLIIVRRDNTEHLIMIGGPNDVLIESEIVRMEARDVRDARRDKASDGISDPRASDPRLADPRLAARTGLDAPTGSPAGSNGASLQPARSEDPFQPPALPQVPTSPTMQPIAPAVSPPGIESADAAARAPTFPLPPRRPTVPAPPPERRVQPTPPDRASRAGEPPLILEGAAPAAPPQTAALQAVAPQASVSPKPLAPVVVPADRPVPARPSSFLKPLPPRPPIRPLKRTTPQAEPGPDQPVAAPPAPGGQDKSGQDTAVPLAVPPAVAPRPDQQSEQRADQRSPQAAPLRPPPPLAASDPAPINGGGEKDGLESLEEEMAKLLGR